MTIRNNEIDQAYNFLKQCGYFYVLTINGDFLAGRPFGAVMKNEESFTFQRMTAIKYMNN